MNVCDGTGQTALNQGPISRKNLCKGGDCPVCGTRGPMTKDGKRLRHGVPKDGPYLDQAVRP